ncbi:uncharacterized protein [Leuresthes tenuis]|uniref:uncharacterized protein n=1 Tax=Leuresthes tenuis TaxID=355514 RepID=UPI003B510E54
MRLTVLCVCGTVLAFLSLSQITADEEVLLDNGELGPCVATLRPEGACRPGHHESSCPYLFSLPPLTLHLPQQLRELEKVMQDLQKLKESVDELREMCADCTVSQTERECGRQKEREHEKLSGKGTREDERNWMNVRLEENNKDFKKECEKDGVKVDNVDRDNGAGERLSWEEKDIKDVKWEADRKSDKRKNEKEESWTVTTKDEKTKTEGEREKGALEQTKVPSAGANERIVDVMREKIAEETNRETDSNRNENDAGKENSNRYQEDKVSTRVKKKEKTEESDHHVWRDKTKNTEKMSQPESSDRKKMFENHGEHTNKEQKQHREETREEMEKGIKVDRNNEKPKQTESTEQTEKESTIKEGEPNEEGREKGKEIKTESEQRDRDGELSSSKTTERTDSFPISPTPHSTTRPASRLDSDKATIFTSFVPSPSLLSPTLSSITDVSHDTIGVYGPTQSAGLRAAGFSEPKSFDAELATVGGLADQIMSTTARSKSLSKVKHGPGSQGHISSTTTTPTTTTPHQKLYITAFPKATDSTRWTPKKNSSSNTKTGVKPLPGKQPKSDGKHKPGIKPEAEQKIKDPKNDRNPDRAPSPDKKTKYNPKQKPSQHKPTTNKSKPGKDSKQIQISKPDQKTPPDILKTDTNLKNNSTPKHNQDNTPDQNQIPVKKKDSHEKSPTHGQRPVTRRPKTVNMTQSDRYSLINRDDDESDDVPISGEKMVHVLKTDKPEQKQKPGNKTQSEEKTKPDEKFELNPNPPPVQESDSKRNETTTSIPQLNLKHLKESEDKSNKNPSQEPKFKTDSIIGQKSDPSYEAPDQRPKSGQETPQIDQKPKPGQEPESERNNTITSKPDQKSLTELQDKSHENPSHESISNPDSTPGKKSDTSDEGPDSKSKSGPEIPKTNQKPKPGQVQESERNKSVTSKPNQKPLKELVDKSHENPSHESKSKPTPGQKIKNDQAHKAPNQRPKSGQKIPKIDEKPKRFQEPESERNNTITSKPDQKSLLEFVDKSHENPSHESKSNQDSTPGEKSDPFYEAPDQRPKSVQEIPKTNQKPKPGQTQHLVRNLTHLMKALIPSLSLAEKYLKLTKNLNLAKCKNLR